MGFEAGGFDAGMQNGNFRSLRRGGFEAAGFEAVREEVKLSV